MLLVDPYYQVVQFSVMQKKFVKFYIVQSLRRLYRKAYKKVIFSTPIIYSYGMINIFIKYYFFYIRRLLTRKKYYNYLSNLINKPRATIHIKNSSVNTYLTFSLDGKVTYAKSAGIIGYRKKYRRIKVAAYKLGQNLASKLGELVKSHNIQSINIALEGYFRFLNAITSSIKRALSKYIGESCQSAFFWRNRLRDWNRRKKNVQLRFRKVYKPTKSQLRYERHIEEQVKRYKVSVGGLRSLFNYTSVDHGGIKKRVRYGDKRYW